MHVKELELINFRNYKTERITFSEGINFFVGENAQGKTNLLEAIYLTCLGRSPRTPRDRELIREGAEFAQVGVRVKNRFGSGRVDIYIDNKNNKRIAINRLPIKRLGELMGTVACVYFSPDELSIIKEGPLARRRMLDVALCQISRAYFYLAGNYNKVLSQRNKLLKSGNCDEDSLDVWTKQLIDYGSKIIKTRRGMVKRLSQFALSTHNEISGGKEQLSLVFESVAGETTEEIAANLKAQYEQDKARDIRLGYTTSGAHKDDVKIMVSSGETEYELRSFGSQGQQRSAALSLKLAELQIIKEEIGESPILILDDVFSELDKSRQENLLNRLKTIQTLISTTNATPLPSYGNNEDVRFFTVKSGVVRNGE